MKTSIKITCAPITYKNGGYVGFHIQFNDRDHCYAFILNNGDIDTKFLYEKGFSKKQATDIFNRYGQSDIDTIYDLWDTDQCIFEMNNECMITSSNVYYCESSK